MLSCEPIVFRDLHTQISTYLTMDEVAYDFNCHLNSSVYADRNSRTKLPALKP